MSFPLPLPGTPAREALGDLSAAVQTLDPRNASKLHTFRDARRGAMEYLVAERAARRVVFIVLRADGERWLVSFGRKGGWTRLWNFGTGRTA